MEKDVNGRLFTDFVFVRHGETEGNLQGLFQGQTDSHLSANGIRQVQAAAGALKDEPFTAAYASDLMRTVETAEIILKEHPGVALRTTPALREWDLGEADGLPQRELLEKRPEFLARFRFESGDFDVPGGESKREFQRRVTRCLRRIVQENPGGCVLLVSHGWTAPRILSFFYGPPKRGTALPVPANAGISRFRWFYDTRSCQLMEWNSTGHLAGLSRNRNPVD